MKDIEKVELYIRNMIKKYSLLNNKEITKNVAVSDLYGLLTRMSYLLNSEKNKKIQEIKRFEKLDFTDIETGSLIKPEPIVNPKSESSKRGAETNRIRKVLFKENGVVISADDFKILLDKARAINPSSSTRQTVKRVFDLGAILATAKYLDKFTGHNGHNDYEVMVMNSLKSYNYPSIFMPSKRRLYIQFYFRKYADNTYVKKTINNDEIFVYVSGDFIVNKKLDDIIDEQGLELIKTDRLMYLRGWMLGYDFNAGLEFDNRIQKLGRLVSDLERNSFESLFKTEGVLKSNGTSISNVLSIV